MIPLDAQLREYGDFFDSKIPVVDPADVINGDLDRVSRVDRPSDFVVHGSVPGGLGLRRVLGLIVAVFVVPYLIWLIRSSL